MGKMGLACRIGSDSHFPCLKQQHGPFRVSVFFQLKTLHAVVSAPMLATIGVKNTGVFTPIHVTKGSDPMNIDNLSDPAGT